MHEINIRPCERMTDGQNGWMDGLTVFVILWSHLDWNKFPWLFEIACFACLACLLFGMRIFRPLEYTTFNVYHISFTHERFVWIFAWPKWFVCCYLCGEIVFSVVVSIVYCASTFFSLTFDIDKCTHYTLYSRLSKPGNGFRFRIKRGIIKESATFDGWTYISITMYLGTSNMLYLVQVK